MAVKPIETKYVDMPEISETFADHVENFFYDGTTLSDRLREKSIQARCQLQVIDLKRGDVVHSLRIEGVVAELYDVVVLPGVRRPTALGFKSDEIRRVISVGAAPQA